MKEPKRIKPYNGSPRYHNSPSCQVICRIGGVQGYAANILLKIILNYSNNKLCLIILIITNNYT